MNERHPEILEKLRGTGRTMRYLTDVLGLDYNRVVRWVNGYGPLSAGDVELIVAQIEEWSVQG